MTQLQDQLKNVSKTLANLSKQLESISKKIVKVPAVESPARKKATTKAKTQTAPSKVRVAAKATASKDKTVLDLVFDVVRRSRNGVSIAKLKEKTGLEARQLSNALYKLSKRGKIEARSRGHYTKTKS
jgi:predicted Rossmann fold nucleotide-binding protein DprA/Smf involved in DNA uptake